MHNATGQKSSFLIERALKKMGFRNIHQNIFVQFLFS